MRGHWWSCMLGLLCMPAEVIANTLTVFQKPSSISHIKVNSSTEITCSTTRSDVMGFYLNRQFQGTKDIVFLSLNNRKVTKNTIAKEFEGRIRITHNDQVKEGLTFTMQLSDLRLDDTDLYYCQWSHFNLELSKKESESSNGTVVIVREDYSEHDPEKCEDHIFNHILISLSATAFTVILFIFIGIVILRCRRFKKQFRPTRPVLPPRANRPQHVCPQQSAQQHYPYLITSEDNMDNMENIGFRRFL